MRMKTTKARPVALRAPLAITAAGISLAAAIPAPVTAAVPAAVQATGQAAGQAAGSTETIEVIGTTPLLGSGVAADKVPVNTSVLNSADIMRTGTADALHALDTLAPGVSLDSASGNPYQPSLFLNGFEASPLQGVSQGVAFYLNGVRFNQSFGDTVNWDLIPDIAISRMVVSGANPLFGLNALGGSVSVTLKNGFTSQGGEAELSGGSFDTVRGEFEDSIRSGNWAFYGAANVLHQGGWRDLQSSDIQNFYGDLGWRGADTEIHLNANFSNSVLNGPGTAPIELLAVDPQALFTAPNLVADRFGQVSVNGNHQFSGDLSVQGDAYYSYFQQRVVNGNAANDAPCNDGSGLLCSGPGTPSTTRGGLVIPDFLSGGPYSEEDDQTTNTNAYGASLQVTDDQALLGHQNHAVVGASFDGAQTEFSATGYIGGLTPVTRDFIGPGVAIDEPGNNTPVRVAISDAYYGVFASDTFNLTPRLAFTASARFNSAQIDLTDQGGGDLTGNHAYNRLNPAVGATYRLTSWLTGYAGYAESNRAPTPAELSCAGPQESCSLANFFVGDPDLKQVVAHTVEAGVRGRLRLPPGLLVDKIKLGYDVGLFTTDLDDDIAFVNSQTLGRAFFTNVGSTRRRGVNTQLSLSADRWSASLSYAYTEATYQSGFVENAGSNPAADANGNITIMPGDRLPGIPAQKLNFAIDWQVTDRWSVGTDGILQSGQYLVGDEANVTPKLPGFFVLNLHTAWRLTRRLVLFGRIDNVSDTRYATFGTFAPTTAVALVQAPGATNPRSISLAAPIGGYGGVRVTF